MNEALCRLKKAVGGVTKMYRPMVEGGSSGKTTPISLSCCSQTVYHESESKFLKELIEFTKKQFSPVSILINTLS